MKTCGEELCTELLQTQAQVDHRALNVFGHL